MVDWARLGQVVLIVIVKTYLFAKCVRGYASPLNNKGNSDSGQEANINSVWALLAFLSFCLPLCYQGEGVLVVLAIRNYPPYRVLKVTPHPTLPPYSNTPHYGEVSPHPGMTSRGFQWPIESQQHCGVTLSPKQSTTSFSTLRPTVTFSPKNSWLTNTLLHGRQYYSMFLNPNNLKETIWNSEKPSCKP